MIQNLTFEIYLFTFSSEKSQNLQKVAKRSRLFYEPQLTQHCKRYTTASQPKTLLILQTFSKNVSVWFQKKFALHHF